MSDVDGVDYEPFVFKPEMVHLRDHFAGIALHALMISKGATSSGVSAHQASL